MINYMEKSTLLPLYLKQSAIFNFFNIISDGFLIIIFRKRVFSLNYHKTNRKYEF